MKIVDAQQDARRAYANGGIGVAVSGTIWLLSGLIALSGNLKFAMIALFFGGMAINPISELIAKQLLKLDAPNKQNKLIWLGLLTVPFILIGMFAGYLLAPNNQMAFFAFTLMAIGARYLSFQMIYGMAHYIVLGFCLLPLGFVPLWLGLTSPAYIAIFGGTIELVFALIILRAKPILK